jgi:hypothetical protein
MPSCFAMLTSVTMTSGLRSMECPSVKQIGDTLHFRGVVEWGFREVDVVD